MNGPTSVINRRSKYSWNYFTEDVKNNQSVSEKKYDKSLENKYKWLKVRQFKYNLKNKTRKKINSKLSPAQIHISKPTYKEILLMNNE